MILTANSNTTDLSSAVGSPGDPDNGRGPDQGGAQANIFADLDSLRLSADAAAVMGATEVLSHVPVRKPNRHEFFRVRPEPEYWLGTGVFEDREERETFFVAPRMRDALLGEIKPVLLVPVICPL
jgi:hypothetical protein